MPLYSKNEITNVQQLALYMHFDSNFTQTAGGDSECPICMESIEFGVRTECKHEFCRECVHELIKIRKSNNC